MTQPLGVIGGGAWGTALAQVLAHKGHEVLLWTREPEVADAVNRTHENPVFLPGVVLNAHLKATPSLPEMAACAAWVLAVPVQHLRSLAVQLAALPPTEPPPQPLIVASKGLEVATLTLPSRILAEILPGHSLAVLSGPSFAGEVARGLPVALTLGCADDEASARWVAGFSGRSVRLYPTTDVIGVQVGGAVKNVLALACGIALGLQLGDNARAALISRGLVEMMRLAEALGGRAETLMGLSGVGDTVLTCSSLQSRNMAFGVALGQGARAEDLLAGRVSVCEGVPTAKAVRALAGKLGVRMPICEAVDDVLHGHIPLQEAIAHLLDRPSRPEGR